jgi:ADP-ribosylglycohydrolase
MCQLRGLLAGEGKFDLFHLCLYYKKWIEDGPFDIGGTTMNGLGPLADYPMPCPAASIDAARYGPGATSLSNGSLMRITPLAVWAQNLSLEEMRECVVKDVSLMHSKSEMWDLCTAYCLAIKVLIKNAGETGRVQLALAAV